MRYNLELVRLLSYNTNIPLRFFVFFVLINQFNRRIYEVTNAHIYSKHVIIIDLKCVLPRDDNKLST